MFLKTRNKVGEGTNPATLSAPVWFAMPGIAGGVLDPAAERSAESWWVAAARGAHPAPHTLPSRCQPHSRLSPFSPAQGRDFGRCRHHFGRESLAGERQRAVTPAAAPPARAARLPLPSDNWLLASQTVSLGPAGFPINFYRKYKMTSGSLWQIGSHSSCKRGRALPSLNFSQMLSSSMESKTSNWVSWLLFQLHSLR